MGNTEYRVQYRIYQEGLRAKRDAANPYVGQSVGISWERGHRDRWLHGMEPDMSMQLLIVRALIILGAVGVFGAIGTFVFKFIRT